MSTTKNLSWRWSASPLLARSEETNRRFSVFRGLRNRQNLGVRNDEVAILALSTLAHLHFLCGGLEEGRFIPLSSNSALAAAPPAIAGPRIENNFAAARHATVFEGVKLTGELPKRFTR